MTKPLLLLVLIATVIGLVINAKNLLLPTLYYPYLVINVDSPENIRIHVLQRGQTQASQCARSLASATSLTGACPICSIKSSTCPTELSNVMRQWLDSGSLTVASARTANGVIIFESPQQHVALAACRASEMQSVAQPLAARITCFPAGSERPLLISEKNLVQREYAEQQRSLPAAVASIVGLIALVGVLLASLRRLVAKDPTEASPLEIEVVRATPSKLKLSNIVKKVADMLFATVLLAALLPIFSLAALLILLLEGPPIFYRSSRFISVDNSVTIVKFRTMVRDATSPKYRLKERYMRDGYLDIPLDCEVYTTIGRILERSQLVETLQLLNILFDGMSLVGNRPLPKDNIELLKKFSGWQERFDSPAGITGISQIVGKYGLLPQQRLYLERMYASIYRNSNGNIVLCDFYIVGYTVLLLLTGRHLDYNKAIALLIRCGADKQMSGG